MGTTCGWGDLKAWLPLLTRSKNCGPEPRDSKPQLGGPGYLSLCSSHAEGSRIHEVPTVRRAKPRKLKESSIHRDLSQKRCWDKQPRQGFPGKKGEFSGLGRGSLNRHPGQPLAPCGSSQLSAFSKRQHIRKIQCIPNPGVVSSGLAGYSAEVVGKEHPQIMPESTPHPRPNPLGNLTCTYSSLHCNLTLPSSCLDPPWSPEPQAAGLSSL